MVLNVHRNHKAYWGRGEGGKRVRGWGEREIIYLSLQCHQQNDSCIKVSSDESHFNVSLIVRDKVTRQCPQTTTFEEKGEPKRNRAASTLPAFYSVAAAVSPTFGPRLHQLFRRVQVE